MPVERQPPVRDSVGEIVAHDHPEIHDVEHVIRHIMPNEMVQDANGGKRLSSGAFSESTGGGMSVDIEAWVIADGLSSLNYLGGPPEGAVRLNVGALRQLGLKVGWDPDHGHTHHGAVWGIKGTSTRRKIRDFAEIIRFPER